MAALLAFAKYGAAAAKKKEAIGSGEEHCSSYERSDTSKQHGGEIGGGTEKGRKDSDEEAAGEASGHRVSGAEGGQHGPRSTSSKILEDGAIIRETQVFSVWGNNYGNTITCPRSCGDGTRTKELPSSTAPATEAAAGAKVATSSSSTVSASGGSLVKKASAESTIIPSHSNGVFGLFRSHHEALERVKTLQTNDPDSFEATCAFGRTMVQLAKCGNVQALKRQILISRRMHVELLDWYIVRMLCGACAAGQADIVALMIRGGVGPAIARPHPALRELVHSVVALVDAEEARKSGANAELVLEMIIKAGASPNHQRHSDCFTPLHLACASGKLSMVRLLLNAGADVNAVALNDVMPLHCAEGYLESQRESEKAKEDEERSTQEGESSGYSLPSCSPSSSQSLGSPLHCALEICQLLKEKGAVSSISSLFAPPTLLGKGKENGFGIGGRVVQGKIQKTAEGRTYQVISRKDSQGDRAAAHAAADAAHASSRVTTLSNRSTGSINLTKHTTASCVACFGTDRNGARQFKTSSPSSSSFPSSSLSASPPSYSVSSSTASLSSSSSSSSSCSPSVSVSPSTNTSALEEAFTSKKKSKGSVITRVVGFSGNISDGALQQR